MSYPAMMAVPLVMEISPVNILNVVVFPAPESKVQRITHASMEYFTYHSIIHDHTHTNSCTT